MLRRTGRTVWTNLAHIRAFLAYTKSETHYTHFDVILSINSTLMCSFGYSRCLEDYLFLCKCSPAAGELLYTNFISAPAVTLPWWQKKCWFVLFATIRSMLLHDRCSPEEGAGLKSLGPCSIVVTGFILSDFWLNSPRFFWDGLLGLFPGGVYL